MVRIPRREKTTSLLFIGRSLNNIGIIQFTISIWTATIVDYKNFCRSIIFAANLIDFTKKNVGSFPFELIFVSQAFARVSNFAQASHIFRL